ncbi:MAG: acyl-CoA dehydrogenase family protein [Proteobacteria bacterium]|nr:acyl-CoA dehydrogenase family protein [Pseudomonadota bacterium]
MLEFNTSQKQIQKAVRAFAKGEFDKEKVLELDKSGDYPQDLYVKAADLGLIGIHFPEDYSGGGMGLFEQALVAEEMCAVDSSLGITLGMASYGAEFILRFGSPDQKKALLPGVAEGRFRCGSAITEPGNGYDISKISTVAVKNKGNYTITGRKTHVVNGGNAGFYMVLCQTDPTTVPLTSGFSLFIVEAEKKGVTVESSGQRLGLNMLSSATLDFDSVEVPSTNLIGDLGKGYDYVQAFLMESRMLAAAQAVGLARGAYERALAHIKAREQFNRPIAAFQALRHKIADMATTITLARLVTYDAARRFDLNICDASTACLAKTAACKAAMTVSDDAVQLLGGYGYMREYEVEHFYRDAKMLEVRDGSPYLLKDIIADSEIGKLKARK